MKKATPTQEVSHERRSCGIRPILVLVRPRNPSLSFPPLRQCVSATGRRRRCEGQAMEKPISASM